MKRLNYFSALAYSVILSIPLITCNAEEHIPTNNSSNNNSENLEMRLEKEDENPICKIIDLPNLSKTNRNEETVKKTKLEKKENPPGEYVSLEIGYDSLDTLVRITKKADSLFNNGQKAEATLIYLNALIHITNIESDKYIPFDNSAQERKCELMIKKLLENYSDYIQKKSTKEQWEDKRRDLIIEYLENIANEDFQTKRGALQKIGDWIIFTVYDPKSDINVYEKMRNHIESFTPKKRAQPLQELELQKENSPKLYGI